MRRLICVFLMVWKALAAEEAKPSVPVPVPVPENLVTLRALVGSLTTLRSQLDQQNARLKESSAESAKEDAKKEIASIQERLEQVERDLESVATGVESHEQDQPVIGKLDLGAELQELVGPLIREVKQATEQPRVIERLRGEVAADEKQLEQAKRALANAEALIKSLPKAKDGSTDGALRKELQDIQSKWKGTVAEVQGNLEATRYRLNDTLAKRKSIWEILTNGARLFFLTRGLNVLLAALAFFGAFLGWRAMHRWAAHLSPWHRANAERPFLARLLDVLYHAMALVIGILAALTMLYSMGDWLLLGLSLIALLALVLAAKNSLPRYYDQARLLLNLGEVREGERVVVNGLPWLVRSLNMTTVLVNPSLRRGGLRVPITTMVPLSSRPFTQGEIWFPCEEGDWVSLSDGTFGKVTAITPEFVQMVQLGGAHRTYATTAFISQNPVNFMGGFRVTAIVKVHPEHRALVSEVIPAAIQESIHEGLLAIVEPQQIKSLKVEFRAVIPNALEFDVVADFDGSVAEKQPALQRTLQQYALAACNKNGWKLGG